MLRGNALATIPFGLSFPVLFSFSYKIAFVTLFPSFLCSFHFGVLSLFLSTHWLYNRRVIHILGLLSLSLVSVWYGVLLYSCDEQFAQQGLEQNYVRLQLLRVGVP